MKSGEHEVRSVREYAELQAHGEIVQRLEKIASERIGPSKHDVWDVQTDQTRWWVITEPTNLYSQDQFPSMTYALSFHIGLTMRVMHSREPDVSNEQRDRLATAWRRWIQAAEGLDRADEAEEFQAVGMRCREGILAMARDIASDAIVPDDATAPKGSDFIHWSELIANHIAKGSSYSQGDMGTCSLAHPYYQRFEDGRRIRGGSDKPCSGELLSRACSHRAWCASPLPKLWLILTRSGFSTRTQYRPAIRYFV